MNYHKTIQCGEGGIIITNSNYYAENEANKKSW